MPPDAPAERLISGASDEDRAATVGAARGGAAQATRRGRASDQGPALLRIPKSEQDDGNRRGFHAGHPSTPPSRKTSLEPLAELPRIAKDAPR
jgi:hypothetical protein